MTNLEDYREYYEHDANCSEDNFTALNEVGHKTCLDCAGIFDEEGHGVCITSKKFDTPPEV